MYFRGVTTLPEKRKRPMFLKLLQNKDTNPINQKAGSFLLHQIDRYTRQIRVDLDASIDKRLVDTFFNLFVIILMFRERRMGLLLSELGGYLCGHAKAPAGQSLSTYSHPTLLFQPTKSSYLCSRRPMDGSFPFLSGATSKRLSDDLVDD